MMRSAFAWMDGPVRAGPLYLHTSTERYGFYGRVPEGNHLLCKELMGSIYSAHYGRLSGAWSRTDRFC